jgi:hypothetical protein
MKLTWHTGALWEGGMLTLPQVTENVRRGKMNIISEKNLVFHKLKILKY